MGKVSGGTIAKAGLTRAEWLYWEIEVQDFIDQSGLAVKNKNKNKKTKPWLEIGSD